MGDVEVEVDTNKPINITINTTSRSVLGFHQFGMMIQLLAHYVEKCSDPNCSKRTQKWEKAEN